MKQLSMQNYLKNTILLPNIWCCSLHIYIHVKSLDLKLENILAGPDTTLINLTLTNVKRLLQYTAGIALHNNRNRRLGFKKGSHIMNTALQYTFTNMCVAKLLPTWGTWQLRYHVLNTA